MTYSRTLSLERVVFLQTAEQTGGELFQCDLFVRPGGFVAGEHIHPHQQERLLIRAGNDPVADQR